MATLEAPNNLNHMFDSEQMPQKFANPMSEEDDEDAVTSRGRPIERQESFDDDRSAPKAELSPRSRIGNSIRVSKFLAGEDFGSVDLEYDTDRLSGDFHHEKYRKACCGLLHPNTKTSLGYDSLQMCLLGYIVWTVPWNIAYDVSITTWFDILVDFAIVFDIILNFHRYVIDSATGILITKRSTLAR